MAQPITEVSTTGFEELRGRLRGPLLLPSAPGYDDARSVWNAMIDKRPAAIVRCLGTTDVRTCLAFAREQRLPISIKGGGHNIAGLAVGEGALMLDMSLMRGVWVDREAGIARAQAGCLLGDVDRETQLQGLAAVLGFVSNTGIAGLTLGGGFGWMSRRFGWTSDNVVAMEMVAADGRIVRVSEKENADLFWGLRGGGGNFGVVTGFDYRLYPIGPEIVGGMVAWRAENAPEVLELVRKTAEQAPVEMSIATLIRPAPPAPWLPKEMHGQPIIGVAVCHTGSIAEAEKAVAPIKAFGKPVGDVLVRRPYVELQSLLDVTQPKGRRYYWKSEYLPQLTAETLAKAAEHGARIPSPHSALILFGMGGSVHKLPNDHSAVGNRDANWVLNITSAWEKASDDAANIEWARSTWRDMRHLSTGGTYVNFLTEDEPDERVKAAYGANYQRLIDVKTKWDPENVFRNNKNVAPRS